MAFMTKCCCCDLRTGVLLIGIFGLIGAGYNIGIEVFALHRLAKAEDFFASRPKDVERFGFTSRMLDIVQMMCRINIGLSVVSLISSISLLIPSCQEQRQKARPFRWTLLIYVAWSALMVMFYIGYSVWTIASFENVSKATRVIAAMAIGIPLSVYFMLVVIAYYIELGEEVCVVGISQPSNLPYVNFSNEPPPSYPAQEYPAKVRVV